MITTTKPTTALSLLIFSWEVKFEASRNSSSGKMPTVQARGPEFRSSAPMYKDDLVLYYVTLVLWRGDQRIPGACCPTASDYQWALSTLTEKTLFPKEESRMRGERWPWPLASTCMSTCPLPLSTQTQSHTYDGHTHITWAHHFNTPHQYTVTVTYIWFSLSLTHTHNLGSPFPFFNPHAVTDG